MTHGGRPSQAAPQLQPRIRGKFLHVIARSEATWQSVALRQHKTMRKYLRQIRRSCEFALSAAYCSVLLQGERIATPVCALVRNDMQKAVACQRLQGRFPAVHRQCPGIVRTGGKFLHVIARSEATWQSVTPAAAQTEKQFFPANTEKLRICPKYY